MLTMYYGQLSHDLTSNTVEKHLWSLWAIVVISTQVCKLYLSYWFPYLLFVDRQFEARELPGDVSEDNSGGT